MGLCTRRSECSGDKYLTGGRSEVGDRVLSTDQEAVGTHLNEICISTGEKKHSKGQSPLQ